jgi:hypothetical protein
MSAIAALLIALQPAPAPTPSQIHNFHDWVVTCDNSLTCEAVSLAPEATPASGEAQQDPWERYGVMRLQRRAGADAPLVISLTDFEGRPARLVQYGRPLEGVTFTAAGEGEWIVEPGDRAAFVNDLYSEEMIVRDASGRDLARFAVRGAHGSLIYMDERQGRLGTPTSLIRPGARSVSQVLPRPPIPTIAAAPPTTEAPVAIPSAQLDRVRRESGCLASELGGTDEAPTFALGGGRTLVLLSCGGGAYNFNAAPYIAWREGGAIRIEPAAMDVEPEEGVDEVRRHYLTNADWDAERRMIHEFARGRGLGDCGVQASYVWTGTMFRLAERREMSECRGTFVYLTTWRTEVR